MSDLTVYRCSECYGRHYAPRRVFVSPDGSKWPTCCGQPMDQEDVETDIGDRVRAVEDKLNARILEADRLRSEINRYREALTKIKGWDTRTIHRVASEALMAGTPEPDEESGEPKQ